MPSTLPRAVVLLILGGSVAAAQPAPSPKPTPPHQTPSQQTPTHQPSPHQSGPSGKPNIQAAPRTPVQRTPLVQPKPGAPGHPTAKPGAKPPTAAPATSPVPAPEPEKPAEPAKGTNTGNPLPRFASLRSDEVNLRTGPGTRYPIDWVYKRRDLPVLIEREFEVWRLVRDPEGTKGWVHQATLAPRRSGVVIGGEHVLRRDPQDDAGAVARLKQGVIVRLRSCEATSDWCQAQVQDYRGWIKRSEIWGTFPGEVIQ